MVPLVHVLGEFQEVGRRVLRGGPWQIDRAPIVLSDYDGIFDPSIHFAELAFSVGTYWRSLISVLSIGLSHC